MSNYQLGRVVALIASIFFAIQNIMLRYLKGTCVFIMGQNNYFVNFILSSILSMYSKNELLQINQYWIIISISISLVLCHLCFMKGAYLETSAKGQIINYLQIFFAYLSGIFILNESVDFLSSIGSFLILTNCFVLIYKNYYTI